MVTVTERDKLWRESQHKANGRKRFTLQKQPPLERMMGGAMYDEEGRLRLIAKLARSDYDNLFSSRRERLEYAVDASTGKRYVPKGRLSRLVSFSTCSPIGSWLTWCVNTY
jgi:hypothetical protein